MAQSWAQLAEPVAHIAKNAPPGGLIARNPQTELEGVGDRYPWPVGEVNMSWARPCRPAGPALAPPGSSADLAHARRPGR